MMQQNTQAFPPKRPSYTGKQHLYSIGSTQLPDNFTPSELDILCGRGKGSWNHEGNKRYKRIIQENLSAYVNAPRKIDKSLVVASVVEFLRDSGSLFVKQDQSTGLWYDIGDNTAREKTGHAIRDHLSSVEKKCEGGKAKRAKKATKEARKHVVSQPASVNEGQSTSGDFNSNYTGIADTSVAENVVSQSSDFDALESMLLNENFEDFKPMPISSCPRYPSTQAPDIPPVPGPIFKRLSDDNEFLLHALEVFPFEDMDEHELDGITGPVAESNNEWPTRGSLLPDDWL